MPEIIESPIPITAVVTTKDGRTKIEITRGTAEIYRHECGGWIPVSERLPEPETLVLAYAITEWSPGWPPAYMVTVHSGQHWRCDSMTVTHWMPLPEPPADVAEQT